MSDANRQIKNSIIYLYPVILSNILPFVTLPIFTRILTREDYGVFALANIYAIFASGLVNFGLIHSYDRNFFQYTETKKRGELLYSTLAFVSFSFFIYGALTYLFKAPLSRYIIGSPLYGNILFLAFCAKTIASIERYYFTCFKNREDSRGFVRYTIIESVLIVLFSLFMVAYLRMGVAGLVMGQLLGSAIVLVLLIKKFLRYYPLGFDKDVLKESLKISYPLTPRIFLGVINTQFDKYLLRILDSIGGAGIYSIGQRVSGLIFAYMTSLQNVFNPQVYKRMFNSEEIKDKSIGRYLIPFFYISIALALFISLFSEEAIYILTPVSYHGAIPVAIILSMYYGILFFGKINGTQLIYAKKTHITSILTLLTIILNIGVSIPFIMKFGVIGAAMGLLIAGLISGGISFVLSQRYYRIDWNYGYIGGILAIFFLFPIAILILRYFYIDYPARLLVKLTGLCIYLYIGIKIGVVTRKNILILKKAVFYKTV